MGADFKDVVRRISAITGPEAVLLLDLLESVIDHLWQNFEEPILTEYHRRALEDERDEERNANPATLDDDIPF